MAVVPPTSEKVLVVAAGGAVVVGAVVVGAVVVGAVVVGAVVVGAVVEVVDVAELGAATVVEVDVGAELGLDGAVGDGEPDPDDPDESEEPVDPDEEPEELDDPDDEPVSDPGDPAASLIGAVVDVDVVDDGVVDVNVVDVVESDVEGPAGPTATSSSPPMAVADGGSTTWSSTTDTPAHATPTAAALATNHITNSRILFTEAVSRLLGPDWINASLNGP